MILIIDNYDSFTYNLVQYFGELGANPLVRRNDEITVEEAFDLDPQGICISPGPCSPQEAGVSNAMIHAFAGKKPILGVCLGHQCIGSVFGGTIIRADRLMHGKVSPIFHQGENIFAHLSNPFEATRYHSLLIQRETFPASLKITAETAEGEIMGVAHRDLPIYGVQFHPESILTKEGKSLLNNYLELM